MEENRLYHYTDVSGFLNIIKSRSIRITRSDFMNDSNECSIFNKFLHTYTEKNKLKSFGFCEDVELLIDKFDFSKYINYLEKHMRYYIFSLTIEDDNLPMWNYYGNNGIQLEFEKDSLIDSLKKSTLLQTGEMLCGQIVYVSDHDKINDIKDIDVQVFDQEKTEKIDTYIQSVAKRNKPQSLNNKKNYIVEFLDAACVDLAFTLNNLWKNKKVNLEMEDKEVFDQVCLNIKKTHNSMIFKKEILYSLLSLSSFLKSDSYKNENEYRIVFLKDDLMENDEEIYFLSNYNNMDFIKPAILVEQIDLQKALISVILSPTMKNLPINQERYIDVIKDFLTIEKITQKKVGISSHEIRW